MKTTLFFAGFFFGCMENLFCQGSNSIVIKPGEDLAKVYNYIYRYPQFNYGKVYLKNGDSSAGKLNYNYLMQAMQFINRKGDTLVLANENTFKFITIGTDTFFYDNNKGYVEQLANYSISKLLLKENTTTSEEKIGAYGIPSSTQNIDAKNTLIAENSYALTVNANMTLTKRKQYFFSYRSNILPVNNKNILKVFAKQKNKIENYLQDNSIDFNNEVDLKKLFTYLITIL